ncbi:hypothetical protein [uncultured Clostridium sp.]|uniref:ATP-dependent DNA ligase n=1 Tax=uncultured Clostridium sp. TaxID=59620 RepID=UPI0032163438
MDKIIEIIKQLQNTSSTNDKLNILKTNKDNELLKRVLYYTYNPFKKYKITEKILNNNIKYKTTSHISHSTIFDLLDVLSESNIDDELRGFVKEFLIDNAEYKEIYAMMLLKDLRINMGVKSINKVWKGLIPQFEVMLADKYFEKPEKVKNKEFLISQKLDGYRLVAINNNGNIEFYTRQGQLVEGLVEIEKELYKMLPNNMVMDGELLAINDKGLDSKDLYRETIKRGRKKGIKIGLEYHVFDFLALDDFKKGISKVQCSVRKSILHDVISKVNWKYIKEVETLYQGKDIDMIIKLLDEQVAMGNEGVMVNIADAPYECKRTTAILKVKKFQEADVRVLIVTEGTGKNKGKLGSIGIQFEYEGNSYSCECGSGFSDIERMEYWEHPHRLLNKIVTIGYFEISQDSKTKKFSLRFPTWKGIIRDDKTEISMY